MDLYPNMSRFREIVKDPDTVRTSTLIAIMNKTKIVELRKTAESHRKWANHCLSVERAGWLAVADDYDRQADHLEQENEVKIHISSFVRRQTPASAFSHWTISDEELLARIHIGIANAKPGYREGVILVPVSPDGFFTGVVELKEGDKLVGEFKARRPGEYPRKSTYSLSGNKIPAKSVYVVLYSHEVLLEGKENETDADYEIVSVNANVTEEDAPIPTGALIANHLGLSGGTATKMTDSEFVAALRVSQDFWKDKALVCPQEMSRGVEILNTIINGWAESGFKSPGNMSYREIIQWIESQGGDVSPINKMIAHYKTL